jgi:C4-dicarboxylate transporter, DctM subunit
MSLTVIGVSGIIVMLCLFSLRFPLAIAMGLVGFIGTCIIVGLEQSLTMMTLTTYRTANNYMMITLPLFMFMGVLAGYAGLSGDAYRAANKWLGHFPGGLAMATVLGCAAFGAVCGSAIATSITMGNVALPEMRKYKYDDQLSLGCITSSGGLGFLIPPSAAFIIYGLLTDQSIGALFISGILPGILIVTLMIITIYILCKKNPQLGPATPKTPLREMLSSAIGVWGILVLFVVVMGGIYLGIFTPTEGAAVGAFGALILGILKRRLTWKYFSNSVIDAGIMTGIIMLLFIGANIFSYFIALTQIPYNIAEWVSYLSMPSVLILISILIIFIIFGLIMDVLPLMVLVVPITYPTLMALNYDPIWFAVLVVITAMIGLVTPPVGLSVYAVTGMVKDVKVSTIFRGTTPFIIATLTGMLIIIIFPKIALFLPSLMKAG